MCRIRSKLIAHKMVLEEISLWTVYSRVKCKNLSTAIPSISHTLACSRTGVDQHVVRTTALLSAHKCSSNNTKYTRIKAKYPSINIKILTTTRGKAPVERRRNAEGKKSPSFFSHIELPNRNSHVLILISDMLTRQFGRNGGFMLLDTYGWHSCDWKINCHRALQKRPVMGS